MGTVNDEPILTFEADCDIPDLHACRFGETPNLHVCRFGATPDLQTCRFGAAILLRALLLLLILLHVVHAAFLHLCIL